MPPDPSPPAPHPEASQTAPPQVVSRRGLTIATLLFVPVVFSLAHRPKPAAKAAAPAADPDVGDAYAR